MLADLDQAFLLLCAANLAYGVSDDSGFTGKFGIQPPVLPDQTTIANLLKRLAFRPDSIHAHQSRGRDGIDAYLYGETEQAAILAFRGTLPLQSNGRPRQIWGDWINSTRMALVDGLPFGIPGKIHEGFAKSLANLWEAPGGLASHLERMAWARTEGRPLLVTGHSKGGALALLAALKLANLGAAELTPAAVVSFGAPRAGNASFAAAYQAVMGDRTWRFEYRDDLVPHLPPPGTLWKTLGRTLLRGQESDPRPAQPQEDDYVGGWPAALHRLGGAAAYREHRRIARRTLASPASHPGPAAVNPDPRPSANERLWLHGFPGSASRTTPWLTLSLT